MHPPRPSVLAVAAVVAALVACGGDGDDATSSTTASTTTTQLTTTTTSTSSTTSTTSTTLGALPAPDRVVARAGGGSGEVELEWSAVDGATGYRVARAGTTAGPFEVVATIDVETGEVTVADEVVNVWSDGHSYIPGDAALTGPDTSDDFRLIDVGSGSRCFTVVALRAGEPGAASPRACAPPP